jgi:magnesium-transporting ATPase (P-type)
MNDSQYQPNGNAVDVALLEMLIDQEQPVQTLLVERERSYSLQASIPFSSTRKRRTVAYKLPNENTVRVVVKGAPEYIVNQCENQLDSNLDNIPLASHDIDRILDETVTEAIAKNGMKSIAIAYKDVDADEFQQLKSQNNNFESEETRGVLEEGLTLVAIAGLTDPLRKDIKKTIKKIMDANTNVRIISGDHKWSALTTAIEIGLIQDETAPEDSIISGDELKRQLSEIMTKTQDTEEGRGETWKLNKDYIKTFKDNILRVYVVIYRADPEVKHMFTAAIRDTSTVVGVTGEGLNDARALSEASVGFAMGEDGCAAAKEHADIILTDDNFTSVLNAIRWGRNIQDNTRKFVQFQMTINISCLVFVILSVITLGFSPFSVFQLLWINLIMDVLAAIAYATEHPHPTELRKERIKPKDKIFTQLMWRAISSQALYQLLVMVILLYFGPAMFNIQYEFYPEKELRTASGAPTYRLQHQTLLFQTFIMMNLFNMINCRVLGVLPPAKKKGATADSVVLNESEDSEASRRELNVFVRFFDNWWFLIILLVELNLQFIMVQYDGIGVVMLTTPLTW